MKSIVITLPHFFEGEAERISRLLAEGAHRVHIRKPGASEADIRALLSAIPAELRSRISLHDCHSLAAEYGIGGVHLNSRNPEPPKDFEGLISRSCHSPEELNGTRADYCFLSPVFDSISKPGYKAAFSREELMTTDLSRVYALGGVSGARFRELRELGFGGAAMLGAVWQKIDLQKFRLQYITDCRPGISVAEGARMALEGGCRWVQLRMKDAAPSEILAAAREIAPLCRRYGATFLLDDHVELVEEAGADGVHLGKNDMPPAEARRILGPGFIIGSTANTFSDIAQAALAGADYIGLGPFRFTTTKKNLSPVLGTDGYRRIIRECRTAGIDLPVVAIGGILPADIPEIMATGVAGIALSGAILNSENPITETQKICRLL